VRARNREIVAALDLEDSVLERLNEAQELGLRLGVASSSSRQWVEGHLERLGVLDRFHAIATRDDVERRKPEPDLYRRVLDLLGVSPDTTIAIEDSPNGVTAAKAAGLFCVAVPNDLTRNMGLHHADLLVDSLRELSLHDLASMFSNT
jgi:HAD superfamily hydrolase (TIGR01509 family)